MSQTATRCRRRVISICSQNLQMDGNMQHMAGPAEVSPACTTIRVSWGAESLCCRVRKQQDTAAPSAGQLAPGPPASAPVLPQPFAPASFCPRAQQWPHPAGSMRSSPNELWHQAACRSHFWIPSHVGVHMELHVWRQAVNQIDIIEQRDPGWNGSSLTVAS